MRHFVHTEDCEMSMVDASFNCTCGAKPASVRPYTRPEHFGIAAAGPFATISTDAPAKPDAEGRWPIEPLGFYRFAWLPKRCRNGKTRWLCWVEDHFDGTFSLGDRAH